MHASAPKQQPVDLQAPLAGFSQCHVGITMQLEALAGLPALAVGPVLGLWMLRPLLRGLPAPRPTAAAPPASR